MVKDNLDRREETCCRHVGYTFQLAARVLLYASSHRQDNTYHGLCYTSRAALAGTRNSSMGPPHEGSIRDRERGNLLPPHRLLFPISSKSSFICIIPDRIAHTTAFVTPVVEHWLEREIAQLVVEDSSDLFHPVAGL